MSENTWTSGDIVSISYKTGEYIGEYIELMGAKAVVKIVAVQKHPTQGDLHNPYEVDVPLFHQRRALSYQEKVVVPPATIRAYQGQVPDYHHSLRKSLEAEMVGLQKLIRWAERSLGEYEVLQKDYFGEGSGS